MSVDYNDLMKTIKVLREIGDVSDIDILLDKYRELRERKYTAVMDKSMSAESLRCICLECDESYQKLSDIVIRNAENKKQQREFIKAIKLRECLINTYTLRIKSSKNKDHIAKLYALSEDLEHFHESVFTAKKRRDLSASIMTCISEHFNKLETQLLQILSVVE